MVTHERSSVSDCQGCGHPINLGFDFSMAFQPIVDLRTRRIFAYEALVRGAANEPASSILAKINEANRYRFDQACRVKAIQLAARLAMDTYLSINFLPNAVYQAETCIRTTLMASQKYGFPSNHIIFEVTEGEKVEDREHLNSIFAAYKKLGFKTAIDDFGAGYSGLNLLAEFQPDIIKLDMALIRNIHEDQVRRAIVIGIMHVCQEIACEVIAEGVETRAELQTLHAMGIHLFQGFYFAQPAFESLVTVAPHLLDLAG
ncbi:EAL domain-containing protein [Trichothermofontia sp.]